MSEETPRLGCTGDHKTWDDISKCERCGNIILDIKGHAVDAYLDKIVMLKRDVANFKSIAHKAEAERAALAMQIEYIIGAGNTGWNVREGKTYLEVRVADGADLSCVGMRRKALRDIVEAHIQGKEQLAEDLKSYEAGRF